MITSKDFKKPGGFSGAARQPAIDRKIREEKILKEVPAHLPFQKSNKF